MANCSPATGARSPKNPLIGWPLPLSTANRLNVCGLLTADADATHTATDKTAGTSTSMYFLIGNPSCQWLLDRAARREGLWRRKGRLNRWVPVRRLARLNPLRAGKVAEPPKTCPFPWASD